MDRVDDVTELARLAAETDKCLTYRQIRECGYTRKEIATLVRRGILRRVLIGVYVIASATITHQQLIRAALLAAGPTAHVAARTALEMRGAATHHRGGHIWIAVTRGQRRPLRRTRIALDSTGRTAVIHFVRAVAPVTTELINGVPVALTARALVDTSARESTSMLRRIIREADYRRLLDVDELAAELDRQRHGSRKLRATLPTGPLASAFAGGADSRAAHRLLRALLARGVRPHAINEPLRAGDFECRPDFWFLHEQLVLEADGPHHELPARKAEDDHRDAQLARFGIRTVRVKTREIRRNVEACVDEVVDALSRRAAPTTAPG